MQAPNTATPLGELQQALAEGLAQPRHAWEAVAIVLALLLAWVLSRWGKRLLAGSTARPPAGVPRLMFPLLGLAFLWVAEGVLRHTHVLASAADARLLRLAAYLVGTLAAVRLLLALLRRVLSNHALIARFERALLVLATLGVALYATGVLGDVVAWLAATEIPLGSAAQVSLWSVLVGSFTVVVALLVAMWLGSLIEERLSTETAIEANLRTVLGRVSRALLLVIALIVSLALSGIDLTILSVFGGALGVGLGLGLQRIASNYVSGFILLLDRSLRIGDMISVDKYYGQVTHISTRYTVLRAADGTDAIVPNEMLVSSPVVNSTLGDRRVVLGVNLAIAPQSDLMLALQLMRDAAKAQVRVLQDPAPLAILREFNGGNLVLEVNFWICDPEKGRQNVQSEVGIAVFQAFAKAGIELAAPRNELQLRGDYNVSRP